jgi:hypothetical protein
VGHLVHGLALAVTLGAAACAIGDAEGADTDAPTLPGEGSTGSETSTAMMPSSSTSTTASSPSSSSGDPTTTDDTANDTTGTPSDTEDDPTTGATTPDDGRVQDGLVALYRFDEGVGSTVADASGSAPALDLQVAQADAVSWEGSGLRITGDTIVASSASASKITEAVVSSQALSVEVWVAPANLTQAGPARIVTVSQNTSFRNFTLGQDAESYVFRVRTTSESNLNGSNPSAVAALTVTTSPTHVLGTRDAEGNLRIYVNAVASALNVDTHEGTLDNWDESFGLALAAEFDSDARYWHGRYFLVAIYDRALDSDEVEQNFLAGI